MTNWQIVKDERTQTLAVAGQWRIRWIGQTFYLFKDGWYVAASRDLTKLRDYPEQNQ